MSNINSFYIVWNPDRSNPQVRHPDVQTARNECDRLSNAYPDKEFFVARILYSCIHPTKPIRKSYVTNKVAEKKVLGDTDNKEDTIPFRTEYVCKQLKETS